MTNGKILHILFIFEFCSNTNIKIQSDIVFFIDEIKSRDVAMTFVRWNVDARNSTRSQPKFDPRQHPRRSEVAFIEFSSRARKCQRLTSSLSRTLVFRFSTRLPNRLFIVRYLRARNLEERIVLSAGGSKGRILRDRIIASKMPPFDFVPWREDRLTRPLWFDCGVESSRERLRDKNVDDKVYWQRNMG